MQATHRLCRVTVLLCGSAGLLSALMAGARAQFAESPFTKTFPQRCLWRLDCPTVMSQPVFTPFIMISEEENVQALQRVTKLQKQQVVLKKKTSPHHPGFPFHPTPNCLKKSSWRPEIRVASFWTWLSTSSSCDMVTWKGQPFGSLGAKKTLVYYTNTTAMRQCTGKII